MASASPLDAEIVQVAEKLPTAPRLLVELNHLMHDPKVEADEVVALLRQDPPLVAQIIRMANSAAYAPREPIGSLERAVAQVGFAEAHRLVGIVAAAQLAETRLSLYPLDPGKLRINALLVALVMEELAKWTHERPHSCYTVGLLRTIGMMALDRVPPAGAAAVPFRESGETALDVWEQKTWGVTNGEVAEKILLHWRLPGETALAIRHHYHPGNRHNPIIHMLILAAATAAELKHGIPGEEPYWRLTSENFERAGLAPACFPSVRQRALRKFEHLRIVVA